MSGANSKAERSACRALWRRLERLGFEADALRELNSLRRFFREREFCAEDGAAGVIPPAKLRSAARAALFVALRAVVPEHAVAGEAKKKIRELGL